MTAFPGSFGLLRRSDQFWLCSILVGLVVLFLSLTWKHTGAVDALMVDMLFYASIFRLLWVKRERLVLDADRASTMAGLLVVLFVLVRSLSVFWFESAFLKLAPVLAFFGVALLASGWTRLYHYWRETLVLCLMSFPVARLSPLIEKSSQIEPVIAKGAGFLLHFLGFEVSQQGPRVALQTGAVEVWFGCSGVEMTLLLLKLALLFVMVLPLSAWQRFAVPLAAVVLGLLLSSVRVAVMLVSLSDRSRFEFWHGPPGAEIFSTLAIVLFFLLCRFMARQNVE